jgi:hypothetical protein
VPPLRTQQKIIEKIEQIKILRGQIKKIQSDISDRDQELLKMFLGGHSSS